LIWKIFKDLKPLSNEERKKFEVYKGKLSRWFETKEEKRAPRGLLKTELSKESSEILIELVRKDKRYKTSIPRIKGFLRSFSSPALQVAAAKILLGSREEIIVVRQQKDYEDESPANFDEDRNFIDSAEVEPEDGAEETD